jgi:AcrR family transcriptional regulator
MSSPGLRERKKQKTRWSIQEHALRLFQEQGYEQTTVDQIAAAAEISPSTFFRYFKTKEDLVVEDEYDPLLLRLLAAAPPDEPPIPALRQVIATAFTQIGPAEMAKIRQRTELMLSVPALRMRMLDNFNGSIDMLAGAVASRTGRDPADIEVRTFGGAVTGALVAAIFSWIDSGEPGNLGGYLDRALAHLESGLTL